jgi:uncharacterized membrane-anchored protein YhcB (DUF1043 family)
MAEPAWSDELPLTTVESFVAAMIEAGPEVAEHMVKAANELLLAAQAITAAAERRLAEQRRLRDEAEARAAAEAASVERDAAAADATGTPHQGAAPEPDRGARLRSVDEVA